MLHKIGIAVSGILWVAGFIALAFLVKPESSPIAPPAVTHETTTTTTVPDLVPLEPLATIPTESFVEPQLSPISSESPVPSPSIQSVPPSTVPSTPTTHPPSTTQPPVTSPPVTTLPKAEPPTNGNSGKPSNPNKPPPKPPKK